MRDRAAGDKAGDGSPRPENICEQVPYETLADPYPIVVVLVALALTVRAWLPPVLTFVAQTAT